jgi:colicin import membrane protein
MTAVAEAAPAQGTDIVALVEATPVVVLTDRQKFSDFYEAMKAECDAHAPDLTTEKGRKAIASLAFKVARTKTAIDDAGKKLNEEARARINAVDEARREIRAQLDALKEEVRRPLTEWEEAEKVREEKAQAELARLREAGRVEFMDTAEDVKARIAALEATAIDADLFRESAGIAEAARTDAIAALQAAHARLEREEAERAELERLRAEAAERERIEAEKRDAEEAERQRIEAEKAEQERLARIQAEAEERARQEAERKAQEEREAAERAHAEALAAERRRAEEAEAAAKAELDRIAREEAERAAVAEREAAEQARRAADREHRGKIMGVAKEAIMEAGPVNEAAARAIVLAIAAGNVPAVSIEF